ncbi:hypothetical protein MBLNU457_5903t1 [Dothideomycetes sp. NU457]
MPTSQETVIEEVMTVTEATSQILVNAQVTHPNEKSPLKLVTGQASSGLIYHTAIVAEDPPDPRWPNGRRTYRTLLEASGSNRRQSMMALLKETELQVEKQVLRK